MCGDGALDDEGVALPMLKVAHKADEGFTSHTTC